MYWAEKSGKGAVSLIVRPSSVSMAIPCSASYSYSWYFLVGLWIQADWTRYHGWALSRAPDTNTNGGTRMRVGSENWSSDLEGDWWVREAVAGRQQRKRRRKKNMGGGKSRVKTRRKEWNTLRAS